MTIKRYSANSDNTITNAFKEDLNTRGTGSNMGASDVLEVFSISGQQQSGSSEASRVLLRFDTDLIAADRTAGSIPASGSVTFHLKMFNVEHKDTTPQNYKLLIQAVSQSWEEGNGLDMSNYTDLTYNNIGSNWIRRAGSTSWGSEGGDYHHYPDITASFDTGVENLEVDVTELVEEWLGETKDNYGFGIRMSGSYESGSVSYYTKKFFGRSTEFFFKKPVLEARWDTSKKDDRGYFYASSSLAAGSDNINTIYLYNYIRGRLRNIPVIGAGAIYVDLYDSLGAGSAKKTLSINTPATGGYVSTGVYSASICIDTTASVVYDVWHNGSGTQYHTGTLSVLNLNSQEYSTDQRYVITINNMKKFYSNQETARFRLYTRPRGWSPTIYTKASSTPENVIVPSASYEIFRIVDNYKIIPFGTGSTIHTGLSYDMSGNYFDLDISMLEKDYSYGIRLAFYNDSFSNWQVQPYEFKFKVRKDEY